MNCRNIHDQLPDVALGLTPVPPEVEAHLGECRECADTLQALRSTMSLLDEWQAPEPSPYWDVRMQARLREEQQRASAGWLQWLRRPALSVAAALGLVIGIGVIQVEHFLQQGDIRQSVEHSTSLRPPERRSPTCSIWTRIQTFCRTSTPLTTWMVTPTLAQAAPAISSAKKWEGDAHKLHFGSPGHTCARRAPLRRHAAACPVLPEPARTPVVPGAFPVRRAQHRARATAVRASPPVLSRTRSAPRRLAAQHHAASAPGAAEKTRTGPALPPASAPAAAGVAAPSAGL